MPGRLEGLVQMMRSALRRETLPPPPPSDPAPGRPSRLRALFAPEVLPLDPERPRVHRNWFAFLFAPERLDPPGGTGPEVR